MSRARRWLPERAADRRALVLDGLLAVCAVGLDVVLQLNHQPGWPADWRVSLAVSAGCAVPIVLRRAAPWPAIWLALASIVAPTVQDYAPASALIAFAWLTYSSAAFFPVRRAALAAALLWVPVLVIDLVRPAPARADGLSGIYLAMANLLIGLVCYLVGRVVNTRRAFTAALEERAKTAEANQRALAEQAVADERRRIARELHDVVAHHVSVTGVLATGARRMLRRDPDAAEEALATIEETSRTALREMRRLLTVLRTEAEPDVELTPQPDLAGIAALVDQVRDAGLPVNLRVEGTCQALDPGVALTIFRIVQEALTNTLKHAGDATAEVRLSFGTQWLVVEVFDTGRGPAPGGGGVGHGLVGMRERVSLYGGTLRIGPRPGGGFRVYARIPIEATRSTEGPGPAAGGSAGAPGRVDANAVTRSGAAVQLAEREGARVGGDGGRDE
jgi:signal transduction histidine kinase